MERMKKNIVTYQKWFNNGKKWCELEVIISRKLFFFSSRRRHTRWNCDWSSDVCSSDLERRASTVISPCFVVPRTRTLILPLSTSFRPTTATYGTQSFSAVRIFFASVSEVSSRSARTPSNRLRIDRSEERRVGKEWRAMC